MVIAPEVKSTTCWCTSIFEEAPFSGIALAVTSLATKLFSGTLSAPLMGIGISIVLTSLIKKGITSYDNNILISIRKEIYKVNKNHPNLQLIALISAFALSFFYRPLGFMAGLIIGTYSTLIFDVERAKLLQAKIRQKNSYVEIG